MFLAVFIILVFPLLFWGFLMFKDKTSAAHNSAPIKEVSVVLIAHNEEARVERKVVELLKELGRLSNIKSELLVISDGSTDGTNGIVELFEQRGLLRVHALPRRKGKANAINVAKREASFENLIFSDSRQHLAEGVIEKLVTELDNEDSGLVSAKLLQKCKSCSVRRLLNFSKRIQSVSGNLVGAYGALFAVKKECLAHVPENTILEDLYISMKVLDANKKVKMIESCVQDVEFERFYSEKRCLRLLSGLSQFFIGQKHLKEFSRSTKVKFLMAKIYKFLSFPIMLLMLLSGQFPFAVLLVFSVLVISKPCRHLMRLGVSLIKNVRAITPTSSVLWHQISA